MAIISEITSMVRESRACRLAAMELVDTAALRASGGTALAGTLCLQDTMKYQEQCHSVSPAGKQGVNTKAEIGFWPPN